MLGEPLSSLMNRQHENALHAAVQILVDRFLDDIALLEDSQDFMQTSMVHSIQEHWTSSPLTATASGGNVLLAVGDAPLRRLCRQALAGPDHTTVEVTRPLQLLDLASRLAGDAVVVDASPLGRDALRAAAHDYAGRLIGLGIESNRLAAVLRLPLPPFAVKEAVWKVANPAPQRAGLALEPSRRVARANGREVALTRSEYQLLDALRGRRGGTISLDEAMEALWGAGEWSRNVSLLRAHVRNLRLKLAQIGLPNAVRSRRGKGYALAVPAGDG